MRAQVVLDGETVEGDDALLFDQLAYVLLVALQAQVLDQHNGRLLEPGQVLLSLELQQIAHGLNFGIDLLAAAPEDPQPDIDPELHRYPLR